MDKELSDIGSLVNEIVAFVNGPSQATITQCIHRESSHLGDTESDVIG